MSISTTATIDDVYSLGTNYPCGNWGGKCLILHNGGAIMYWLQNVFGGTNSTNGYPFHFDSDMTQTDSTTNGPEKAVELTLYYSGRITDRAGVASSTTCNNGGVVVYGPLASATPDWFNW